MLISMVYTFTNEMQITFLKTVGGVILANEAICVQYNGRQYNYDTNIQKKNPFAFLCSAQFNKQDGSIFLKKLLLDTCVLINRYII